MSAASSAKSKPKFFGDWDSNTTSIQKCAESHCTGAKGATSAVAQAAIAGSAAGAGAGSLRPPAGFEAKPNGKPLPVGVSGAAVAAQSDAKSMYAHPLGPTLSPEEIAAQKSNPVQFAADP